MSYNELITLIDAVINRNGVQAITGQVLNGVLKAMVQQLGAGYALGGVAHPTDDPGTPDAPVCYFASETGTYTNFDNLTIAAGELALICYDLNDGWSKSVMYDGFQSVQASVDNNVGTPDVQVSYNNGVLSFAFENLKGNTGDAAGFGTISASVDDQIGTPSVSVQESGPDTAKNLAFAFHNLKGETGVTSVLVSVDNTSGTPQCAVSLNGQQLTLAFTGLKGAQGDTGVSADYPITIVNNLTTNDPTSALSAAQGVVLEGEISQLEHEATDLRYDVGNRNRTTSHDDLTVTTWTDGKANIADSSDANFGSAGTSSAFSITDKIDISAFVGKTLTYTRWVVGTGASANTKKYGLVFYNSSNAAVAGQQVDVSGEGGFSETSEITVPSNAKYASFTFPTTEKTNFSAYVEELVIGDFTSGLGKRAQDLEAEVSEHIDLGNWNIGSIAPGPSSIPDYASTTRLRMKEQKAISKSGNYKITCANGYLFLIYVAGKIGTATWTNNRIVSLAAGDIYRIAIKTDPETDFSGYTQEQVNNVVSSANVQMTGGYIVQKMADDVADLSAKSNRLMADFKYSEVAIFNGTDAYCELNTPIVLSQNGDSIEITAIDIEATNGSGGGYAFGYGGSVSKIGIACGQTCRGWRADDGTWAGQADNIPSLGTAQIIKIEYADNKVYFSINGVVISTSTTQRTLTVKGFGRTAPTQYGYWKGKIANIKHNGNDIYLSEVSTFYNVTFDKSGTHLTDEQQKAVEPKLMAKKSAGYLHIYRKNALNEYIHYVLMKRALEYSVGVYPSNYDIWEVVNIYISNYVGGGMVDTLRLTAPSQYEIAINTPSAESTPVNRYVCGANHGFEKIIVGDNGREFRIMIDGEIVGEDATFDLKAINSVECIQHSEIFKAYSESDKIAEATKIWSISPEQELTIKMSVVFTAITSVHQMQMGMFGAYRRVDGNTSNPYLTNRAIKDSNPFKIYDVSDGWSIPALQNTDNGCFRITEYGEKGFGLSLIVLESNRTPNGGMFVNTNNGVYNKMYNDVTGDKSVSVSEEYHATVKFGVA